MTDENVNEESQEETPGQEPEATDAPEGRADVENLPVEDVPQGDSAQGDSAQGDSAEGDSAEPETPAAVEEQPGLDEPPGGEPATEEPETAPEAVGQGPAAEPESSEEPVEGPAEETAADEPAAEAESSEEPVEGAPATAPTEDPAAEETPVAAAPEPKRKKKRLPRALRRPRSKRARERPAERKPIARLPKPEHDRGRRQLRQGTVVSAAADKTIVVRVDVVKVHPMYKKVIKRSTRLHAHDEENQAKVGDIVRVVETRPLSKLKRWRLQEVVEAAK
jgi:small subunit ribosomal protein S17